MSPGSILATFLAVLTSLVFTFYINNYAAAAYNKLYGSIGTLIVVMLWLYLNSLIILIGFELNASIDLGKRTIKIVKPQFNTFKTKKNHELSNKKAPIALHIIYTKNIFLAMYLTFIYIYIC